MKIINFWDYVKYEMHNKQENQNAVVRLECPIAYLLEKKLIEDKNIFNKDILGYCIKQLPDWLKK